MEAIGTGHHDELHLIYPYLRRHHWTGAEVAGGLEDVVHRAGDDRVGYDHADGGISCSPPGLRHTGKQFACPPCPVRGHEHDWTPD